MNHSDFTIGLEFYVPQFEGPPTKWRCTDIGTRTIAAIRIDGPVTITTKFTATGEIKSEIIDATEASRRGMFNGPPYSVVEHLFDEDDIEDCVPDP